MLFLGIDFGQINSSYSIQDENKKILRMGFIPIVEKQGHNIEHIGLKFKESLDILDLTRKIGNHDEIIIIIEIQRKDNVKNCMISAQCSMYFNFIRSLKEYQDSSKYLKIKDIIGYSSSHKLNYYDPVPNDPIIKFDYSNSYYKNKKIAKQQAEILMKRHNETEFLDFYLKEKKRDDLADSYLMTLAYVSFEYFKQKCKYTCKRYKV